MRESMRLQTTWVLGDKIVSQCDDITLDSLRLITTLCL